MIEEFESIDGELLDELRLCEEESSERKSLGFKGIHVEVKLTRKTISIFVSWPSPP